MRRYFESLLVLIMMLASSRIFLDGYAPQIQISLMVMGFILWVCYSRTFSGFAITYLYVMVAWVVYICATTNTVDMQTVYGHFVRIIAAVFIASFLGVRFFNIFASWTVRLAAAGLPVFVIGALYPALIYKIYDAWPLFLRLDTGTIVDGHLMYAWRRVSLGFVTLSVDRSFQNHGFMWEPAAFAMMTAIALMIRLIQGRRIFSPGNLILIVATLSTLSTTAFMALILISLYWASRQRGAAPVLFVLAIPALFVLFSSFGFLWPKIAAELEAGYSDSMVWSLSRYASFIRDFREFSLSPLLGAGIFDVGRPLYDPTHPSNNGLSDFLVRFGLIWTAITVAMYSFSIKLIPGGSAVGVATAVAVILIFAWSEKFFELPLFLTFQFIAASTITLRTLKPIPGSISPTTTEALTE